ncbi:hypothetical protein [Streptomyces sp. IBSBF 2435]|uniref:hypothetical protein n=1 Tax=Streptomyces sp. IBSBF 2435 TaxID=2903531 RepID=UPI002FDC0728
MAATDPSVSTPQPPVNRRAPAEPLSEAPFADGGRKAAVGTVRATTQRPGHDYVRGGMRFAGEVAAWVCTPWALWPYSVTLAICAVLLLIGLPAVFSTPGDRPGGDAPVAVPGIVTILLVVLQLVAAAASAWALRATWIAATVTVLCLVVPFAELPRWRVLLSANRDRAGLPAHG